MARNQAYKRKIQQQMEVNGEDEAEEPSNNYSE
jgi:hypothetical protein